MLAMKPIIALAAALLLSMLIVALVFSPFDDWPIAGLERARFLVNDGQVQAGLNVYSSILAEDSRNPDALLGRADAYRELGLYELALTDLGHISDRETAGFARAIVYVDALRHSDAIEELQQLIEEDCATASVHALMASCYSHLGNMESSLHHYKRTAKLEPLKAIHLMNAGGCLVELERFPEAIETLSKAIELAPDDYRGWALRCNARRLHGDMAGSESDAMEAQSINPNWGLAE